MKLLVIGGSYFLGKHFVQMMAKENDITVFNRGNRPLEMSGVREIRGDRNNKSDLEQLAGMEFDVVVDFCAYKSGDIASVIEAITPAIKQYIFISTVDIYKKGSGQLLDENSPLGDVVYGGEVGAYIAGKIALENELAGTCMAKNIGYTSVRPAIIYGPDNYAPREDIFFNWIDSAGQVLTVEAGTGVFQMVYVEDVARVIKAVCGNASCHNKAVNVCQDSLISYDAFLDAVAAGSKKSFERIALPASEIIDKGIALPFPLTAEESERYTTIHEDVKALLTIDLTEGLRASYEAFCDKKIFETIDSLFDEAPKKAEEYMVAMLEKSQNEGKNEISLKLYNELIGYYRQTSEKDKLCQIINGVCELLESMQLQGTINYATTMLNVANAYRSIGELELAQQYYDITQNIYNKAIEENRLDKYDLCVAGLYNNLSLLCQEKKDYREAEELLKKALEIVTFKEAGFEIAVTYANLANTMLLARDYEASNRYADEAIARFKARNYLDAHYCAALSAKATCYYEWGEIAKAKALFEEALAIVENTIGRNSQYERLKDSIKMCEANTTANILL